jgi:hypothetical protein
MAGIARGKGNRGVLTAVAQSQGRSYGQTTPKGMLLRR